MKVCNKCSLNKPFSEFSKNIYGKNGLQSYCKVCRAMLSREQNQANPEKKRESSRRWDSANRAKKNERARERYKENPIRQKEATLQWKKANPTKSKVIQKRAD